MIHEAYGRLAGESFENRRHLFFAYARAMRQSLVDRARRNNAANRGGGLAQSPLNSGMAGYSNDQSPIAGAIEIAEMIEKLRSISDREASVVELRYFGGLADHDIAEVLGVSERTVQNDWARAKERLQGWLA